MSRRRRSSQRSASRRASGRSPRPAPGVLIEPSTKRTSNGPDDRLEVASANSTMSTRSAMASSSSSRSRSVSWQPSHDANLTTPMRGRRVARGRAGGVATASHHRPSAVNASPSSATREHRSVAADEERPELAVAARRRLRRPCSVRASARCARGRRRVGEGRDGRLHHPVRTADEGRRPLAGPWRSFEELGDDADAAEPLGPGRGRRSPRPRGLSARRGPPSRRRTDDLAASGPPGRDGRRRSDRARARIASMTGRSGASPMPPATMTTSPP